MSAGKRKKFKFSNFKLKLNLIFIELKDVAQLFGMARRKIFPILFTQSISRCWKDFKETSDGLRGQRRNVEILRDGHE